MKFSITTRDEAGYVNSDPLIADEDDPESMAALYDIAVAFYSTGTVFDLPVGGTIEIERTA